MPEEIFASKEICEERSLIPNTSYTFEECYLHQCMPRNDTEVHLFGKTVVCNSDIDYLLGVIHLIIGLIGIFCNTITLVILFRLGTKKPYYVIIIFETVTDLIVCFVALYTGVFLILERPSSFDTAFCQIAGWLWNWNMITTPLLLSLAGLLRIRAVYLPYDKSFVSSKGFISLMCVAMYIYGGIFACYPFFFTNSVRYDFFEWWSICDFTYNEQDKTQALIYSLVLGPLPLVCSLLTIILTNLIIARYLVLRYYKTWKPPNKTNEGTELEERQSGEAQEPIEVAISATPAEKRQDKDSAQSKQVVWSLFLMTMWYLICYTIIIVHNFRNLVINFNKNTDDIITRLSSLGQTYFYAAYNFSAYLNSFANPIIQLFSGNTFRAELHRLRHDLSHRIRHNFHHNSVDTKFTNTHFPSTAAGNYKINSNSKI